MRELAAFGDSFVWGSEIKGNQNGELSWTGLAAAKLGWHYTNHAIPGCGNERIAQQVLDYFGSTQNRDVLAVINWTWPIRFDFYTVTQESWVTLGPTCVPNKLQDIAGWDQAQRIIDFYQDYLGHSTIWDKWRSLLSMYATQCYLDDLGIVSIETNMDVELFDTESHAPIYIQQLQKSVQSRMRSWQGGNFLEWCQARNFRITEPGLHPLGEAHVAAAEFWTPVYQEAMT